MAFYQDGHCAKKGYQSDEIKLVKTTKEECVTEEVKPEIILICDSEINVEIKTDYQELGYQAISILEKDITDQVIIRIIKDGIEVENIDINTLGVYEITYSVENKGKQTTVIRKVNIVDTIPPILTIMGDITIYIDEVEEFNPINGVNVIDNSGEVIVPTVSGTISELPGEYTITHKAEDSSGNEIEKTRIVKVISSLSIFENDSSGANIPVINEGMIPIVRNIANTKWVKANTNINWYNYNKKESRYWEMIDLHTHTKYSDGTWTVEELLKQAEKAGVTILSITDHDCVAAHIQLKSKNISELFSGKLIVGGEFNAMFNNAKIELLGYGFNVDKVNEWIKKTYSKKKYTPNLDEEFNMLVNACKKNNVKIDDNLEYNKEMGWPIDIVFESLKKYDENKNLFTDKEWIDIDHFFRCCTCNSDFPLYIDFSNQTPNAEEVSKAIRDAGGKVFLAHLFTYPLRDYEKYLDSLRENDIVDGIETYYSTFTEKQMQFIEKYCSKYNLFKSVGTDCHGLKKSDRKIGIGYGNMKFPEDIVSDWV